METFSVLDDKQIKTWVHDMGIDDPYFFYDYLMLLESRENWTFDKSSECYQKFSQIADAVSAMLTDNPGQRVSVIEDHHLTDFLKILAYRNVSASFRLLSILHKIQPSLTVQLLQECTTNQVADIQPEAMLFLTRIQLLLKTECVRRIFGRQRRKEIIATLEKHKRQS